MDTYIQEQCQQLERKTIPSNVLKRKRKVPLRQGYSPEISAQPLCAPEGQILY